VGLDAFLRAAADAGRKIREGTLEILGPASALIARRADHYRAHLLIEAAARSPLQRFLGRWLPRVEELSGPPGLRWSIDVDPLEVD
jgi:primosomal protein N' (replication factor Y)